MTTTDRPRTTRNRTGDAAADGAQPADAGLLLGRAGQDRRATLTATTGRLTSAMARTVIHRMLDRITSGQLIVVDRDGSTHRFGPRPGSGEREAGQPLTATIEIRDDLAWTSVLREGSAGLGRGYIERWWTSEDPVALIRILIRNLHGLDDIRNRVDRFTGRLGDAARRVAPRTDLRRRDRDDIGAHYDIGNDFFRLFLDETMTYSSGVFTAGATDLRSASLAKYDRLLTKLGVGAEHRLLEIGSGWGGLAIRAAETRGPDVTTTTVSRQQYDEASKRVAASGAGDRVRLLNQDWRDLAGRFDRVLSIEMIEAVDWRDYDRFFATIERCLTPDGMVGLQAICVPDRRFARAKKTQDFIRRFVFPGGCLPSLGAVADAVGRATRLQILDVEDLSAHYAATLRMWADRFERRLDDVLGLGLDDRFCQLWRFYLAYCEAGFLERHCTVNQIVLVGPDWRPDGLELRPL